LSTSSSWSSGTPGCCVGGSGSGLRVSLAVRIRFGTSRRGMGCTSTEEHSDVCPRGRRREIFGERSRITARIRGGPGPSRVDAYIFRLVGTLMWTPGPQSQSQQHDRPSCPVIASRARRPIRLSVVPCTRALAPTWADEVFGQVSVDESRHGSSTAPAFSRSRCQSFVPPGGPLLLPAAKGRQ